MRRGRPDTARCYGCQQPIAEKDIWWLKLPSGATVTVDGACWSAARELQPISVADWQKRQRSFSGASSRE